MNPHIAQPGDATPRHAVCRLVRPFTLVGGRTRPTRDVFTLITLVTTVDAPAPHSPRPLSPEQREILLMCTTPKAVAEVAARLDLPVSVATVMLSDMLDEGLVTAHPPDGAEEGPGPALLRRVREGLARL
ncbi:DUF742 domain-containing protein [Streptomyces sp. NPDC020801]|uniref:DUF742 domain-containing protein n=1 Tax=unclassified Streptomyces TaxID=2593676 RepID=UPI00378AF3D3